MELFEIKKQLADLFYKVLELIGADKKSPQQTKELLDSMYDFLDYQRPAISPKAYEKLEILHICGKAIEHVPLCEESKIAELTAILQQFIDMERCMHCGGIIDSSNNHCIHCGQKQKEPPLEIACR